MSEESEIKISPETRRKDKLIYLRTIGHRALRDRNVEELEKIAEQILELDPNYALAHYWLGIATSEFQKDSEIIENHFRNAIICDPRMSQAYSSLANFLILDLSRENETREYLLKAIEYDKANAGAYYLLGRIKSRDGSSPSEAEECYRMALQLNPQIAGAHICLGSLLLRFESRTSEAKVSFEKAIELDQNNSYAYDGLGHLCQNQGKDYSKAEEYFRKANELKPDDAGFYLKLGFLYSKQKRFYEAIEFFQKSAMLNSTNFVPLSVICSIYRSMDHHDESRKYLMLAEMIIKKDGFEPQPADYYSLACLYSLLERKNDALKYLKLAIENNPFYKDTAKNDPDFDFIKNSSQFKKITGS